MCVRRGAAWPQAAAEGSMPGGAHCAFLKAGSQKASHAGASHLVEAQKPHALHRQSKQWWAWCSAEQNLSHDALAQ